MLKREEVSEAGAGASHRGMLHIVEGAIRGAGSKVGYSLGLRCRLW